MYSTEHPDKSMRREEREIKEKDKGSALKKPMI